MSTSTLDELVERAKVVANSARGRAEETEAMHRIPDATIAELWDAGLMRVVQPLQFGGEGRPIVELYELAMKLGEGCGSSGWVYCVLAGHATTIALYPTDVQEEVWGDNPNALACSAFMPTGQAEAVDGGFLLSGTFPFASGCDHAQYALCGAMIPGANGFPQHSVFLVPTSQLSKLDDWNPIGLVGTGSRSLVADQVFVPANRIVPFPPFIFGPEPFSLLAPLVGAAFGGLMAFIEDTKTKPPRLFMQAPKDSEHDQVLIGESFGEIRAARTLLLDMVRTVCSFTDKGEYPPPRPLAGSRATTALISRLTLSSIERVYGLTGGRGIHRNTVTRALNDVRAGVQHTATNTHLASAMAGSLLLNS